MVFVNPVMKKLLEIRETLVTTNGDEAVENGCVLTELTTS